MVLFVQCVCPLLLLWRYVRPVSVFYTGFRIFLGMVEEFRFDIRA